MANGNVAQYPNTRLYRTFDQFQLNLAAMGAELAQLSGSVPGITQAIDNLRTSGDRRLDAMIIEFARLLPGIAEAIDNFRVAADRRLDAVIVEFARFFPAIDKGNADLRSLLDYRLDILTSEVKRIADGVEQRPKGGGRSVSSRPGATKSAARNLRKPQPRRSRSVG